MKKITITLLLSFSAFVLAHGQTLPLLTGVSGASGPTGSTGASYVTQETGTGDIGVGIVGPTGITGPTGLQVVLGVGNQTNTATTAPHNAAVFGVVNLTGVTGSCLASGNSMFTMLGLRMDPTDYNHTQLDFSVDQNGLCGIGFPAAYFNPSLVTSGLFSGSILGVIDPNNGISAKTPLLTISTNTNNPTTFNLAAMTVDYRGYTSLGAYFPPDEALNPAHLLLTDPDGGGTDALFGVFTNTNNPTTDHLAALQVDYRGYTAIGAYFSGSGNPAHLYLTDPNPSGTGPLMDVVTNASTQSLYINAAGQVGIGTASPATGVALDVQSGVVRIGDVSIQHPATYSGAGGNNGYGLFVQWGVLAESFRCAAYDGGAGTFWTDYVFDKDYKLKSLSEVESYIKANHHLPDVPSTEDVECDGIDMAKMDAALLKKIEELTLYVLELKKDNEAMKAEITNLKK